MAAKLVFRKLRSNEIEVRISRVNNGGVSVLLYIDARAVMRLMDETVGAFNWTDEYREMHGSVFCRISVRNPETGEWISKEDVGSESNVEKEKGQVSDALKRAAVKWGIGRELYTAPDIFIPAQKCNMQNNKCYDKFAVDRIMYNDDGEIIYVRVINQTITNKTGQLSVAYEYCTAAAKRKIEESRAAAAAKKAQAANAQQQHPQAQEQPRQQAPAQAQATQQHPQQQGQPTQQQGQARQGQATQQPRQQQGRPTQQTQGQQAQRGNGQAAQPQQPKQQQRPKPQPQPQQRGNNVDSGPLPFEVLPFPSLQDLGFAPTYEDDDEDELPFCN